ncbi:hypothetical protein EON67_11305 [archaeon]|nr:MAG: hypothetical protein EON67_11305 [archaeon]
MEAELDSSASTIADKVAKYFGMREVVLTAGSCPLQVALLAAAAKPLKPEVVVATSGVEATGIATQRALAAASRRLCTTLIPDSSVAALMARVDKVLLPAAGVCADGSVIVPPGSYGITLAAAAARVPSLVLPADMASALGSVRSRACARARVRARARDT